MKLHTSGFTLVEIIVVVTIITILATSGILALNEVRKDARDARRIEELQTIAKVFALELVEEGRVFACEDGIKIELDSADNLAELYASNNCADRSEIEDMLREYFGGRVPHDPLGPGHPEYFYYYDAHGCDPQPNGLFLFAPMENPANSNRDEVCGPVNADGSGNNQGYYNYGPGGVTDVRYPYAVRIR